VVDDSDIARRFLTTRLLPWGVRSDPAVTSAQVIELLAQRSYDLIFLDIELGPESELDGLALCRHIKRSALAISATVIVVSAHHSEVDRARGSLAGCDVYLGKPIKEAELAALLRRQGLVPPESLLTKPPAAPAAPTAAAAAPSPAVPTTAPKRSPA
jgi:DNA-binding response OmpR family regulator